MAITKDKFTYKYNIGNSGVTIDYLGKQDYRLNVIEFSRIEFPSISAVKQYLKSDEFQDKSLRIIKKIEIQKEALFIEFKGYEKEIETLKQTAKTNLKDLEFAQKLNLKLVDNKTRKLKKLRLKWIKEENKQNE